MIEKFIEQYEKSLERKRNLIKPYHDKKKTLEDLTVNESTSLLILEAEAQLLREFVDDLKYIKDGGNK